MPARQQILATRQSKSMAWIAAWSGKLGWASNQTGLSGAILANTLSNRQLPGYGQQKNNRL
jgi:hypothetical protein